jgi:glycopeptide antibiotics resistance protein
MRVSIQEIIVLQIVAIIVFSILLILKMKKHIEIRIDWVNFLFYMYIAGLISIVFLPIGKSSFSMNVAMEHSINVIPFKDMVKSMSEIGVKYQGDVFFHISLIAKNVIGNIFIMIPFGMFTYILEKNKKKVIVVLIRGFLITVFIESIQLFMVYIGIGFRRFDVDDLIMNTIGFLAGYCLMRFLSRFRLFDFIPYRSRSHLTNERLKELEDKTKSV